MFCLPDYPDCISRCQAVMKSVVTAVWGFLQSGMSGGSLGIITWWLIPLSKWVITPVINGISRVNPLITGVITHLLSGMSHQVGGTIGLL